MDIPSESNREFEIEICDTQSHVFVDPDRLRATALHILKEEQIIRANISIALVDDEALHQINRRYLGHDWPTDVVTFCLSEVSADVLVGELIISCEMAAAQARERGVPAMRELALYVVHGLLHLCGYDDQRDSDAAEMRFRELVHLETLGFSDNFGASFAGLQCGGATCTE